MHRLPRSLAIGLITLSLVPAALQAQTAPVPAAASGTAIRGIDLMTATVMTKGQSSFSGVAVRARLQSDRLIKQIELMPSIEYWRNSSTLHPYDIHAARKDATLAFDVRYNFTSSRWRPYLGGGWALHFISSSVDAPSLGIHNADDSITKGNLAALGGISFAMNDRIDNIFEVKYHHLSDYRQVKINWGLAIKL